MRFTMYFITAFRLYEFSSDWTVISTHHRYLLINFFCREFVLLIWLHSASIFIELLCIDIVLWDFNPEVKYDVDYEIFFLNKLQTDFYKRQKLNNPHVIFDPNTWTQFFNRKTKWKENQRTWGKNLPAKQKIAN